MVNTILFNLDYSAEGLSDADKELISKNFIQYKVINIRNNIELVEATLYDINVISYFVQYFSARNPVIIGVWNKDGTQLGTEKIYNEQTQKYEVTGTPMYTFNESAYLDTQPDKLTMDGETPVYTRHTEPVEAHTFWGMEPKIFD